MPYRDGLFGQVSIPVMAAENDLQEFKERGVQVESYLRELQNEICPKGSKK